MAHPNSRNRLATTPLMKEGLGGMNGFLAVQHFPPFFTSILPISSIYSTCANVIKKNPFPGFHFLFPFLGLAPDEVNMGPSVGGNE
jgi:hypothetical protein